MNKSNLQHEIADSAVFSVQPIVSVWMVTYNHGSYLAQSIEGVIAQKTDFPIELIIGEDCSTDNTREIALDYQKRFPHIIRVIYSDYNVGGFDNGQRVRQACRGEYIAFCEGDDYWIDPYKLQKQVAILSKFNNIDICIHSCYSKSAQTGQEILAGVRSSSDCILSLSEIITDEIVYVPSASMIIRRNALIQIANWMSENLPPCGDYFIQVFASKRGGAYYLNKPMSIYRINTPGSWTQSLNTNFDLLLEMDIQFFYAIKKMECLIPGQEEAFKHKYIYYYSRFINYKKQNLAKMEKMIPPLVEHLYGQSNINSQDNIGTHLNWAWFSKFAYECAKAITTKEQNTNTSVYWQFLRVSKTFLIYLESIMESLFTQYTNTSKYEKTIAKWKAEGQFQFLKARCIQLINLIKKNLNY
ncbi:MAG: glycosyltransferase [Methylomonas sp.]|jgi:glycosyltransferase involved in cell wall biosynthesis